jgi:hypothetical protein
MSAFERTETARRLFTLMPSEVFDLWICPGIDAYGWPFSSLSDSVTDTKWDRFFIGRTLSFWTTVEWRLLSLPMNQSVYHPETLTRVKWIVDYCAFGQQTPTADVHKGAVLGSCNLHSDQQEASFSSRRDHDQGGIRNRRWEPSPSCPRFSWRPKYIFVPSLDSHPGTKLTHYQNFA